jgi:hypothetical protein
MTAGETHFAAEPTDYNYVDPAPRGVKLTLLTIGNIQVTGQWDDSGAYKAWAPLLKRDKELERQLGLL